MFWISYMELQHDNCVTVQEMEMTGKRKSVREETMENQILW